MIFSDEYFMTLALEQAQRAMAENEIPVGAIVTAQNIIIGKAYNQTERLKDVTAHAEILAISAATQYLGAKYLHDCTLYVTLEPCAMCAGALFWSQIGRVVYGAEDEKRGFMLTNPNMLHPKTQLRGQVMAAESKSLLNFFFSKLRT